MKRNSVFLPQKCRSKTVKIKQRQTLRLLCKVREFFYPYNKLSFSYYTYLLDRRRKTARPNSHMIKSPAPRDIYFHGNNKSGVGIPIMLLITQQRGKYSFWTVEIFNSLASVSISLFSRSNPCNALRLGCIPPFLSDSRVHPCNLAFLDIRKSTQTESSIMLHSMNCEYRPGA